ncbi:UNVERIFIED_ORG: hypothetical protein ABIC97_004135 [Peribacillus simplex]
MKQQTALSLFFRKVLPYLFLQFILIVGVWYFNYFFPEIKLESFYPLVMNPDIGSTLFGVTSAILSLMGLIAIFVSLNTQHNIQRCREIYWEMTDLPLRYRDSYREMGFELRRLLHNYSIALTPSNQFTQKVITISKATIVTVIVLWTFYAISYYFDDFNNENSNYLLAYEHVLFLSSIIAGTGILLMFFNVIEQLKDIKQIDDKLEDIGQFFNVNNNLFVPTLALVANEIELMIDLEKISSKNPSYKLLLIVKHNDKIKSFKIYIKEIKTYIYDPLRGHNITELNNFNVNKDFDIDLSGSNKQTLSLDQSLNMMKYKNKTGFLGVDFNNNFINLSFVVEALITHNGNNKSIINSIPIKCGDLHVINLKDDDFDSLGNYPTIISSRENQVDDRFRDTFENQDNNRNDNLFLTEDEM